MLPRLLRSLGFYESELSSLSPLLSLSLSLSALVELSLSLSLSLCTLCGLTVFCVCQANSPSNWVCCRPQLRLSSRQQRCQRRRHRLSWLWPNCSGSGHLEYSKRRAGVVNARVIAAKLPNTAQQNQRKKKQKETQEEKKTHMKK